MEARIGNMRLDPDRNGVQPITLNTKCGATTSHSKVPFEIFRCIPLLDGQFLSLQNMGKGGMMLGEVNIFSSGLCLTSHTQTSQRSKVFRIPFPLQESKWSQWIKLVGLFLQVASMTIRIRHQSIHHLTYLMGISIHFMHQWMESSTIGSKSILAEQSR